MEKTTKARTEEIEALANSCQLELYKTIIKPLRCKYDHDTAGKVAAGLCNYIMQFGNTIEAHSGDPATIEKILAELRLCHAYIDYIFQQNMLGCIILLASAWKIPLDKFTDHIRSLHNQKLFDLGPNTPNVSKNLPAEDLVYMFEAASIVTERH
jgi:hypothetical protein